MRAAIILAENDMADPFLRQLMELLKVSGNEVCADCSAPDPEWASYNLGIFICTNCAGIHRKMGSHISKTKSLKLDKWGQDQINVMAEIGNRKANQHHQSHIPLCYKIPTPRDCQVLREQWIRAKYDREEFIYVDRQVYTIGYLERYLWKRGRNDEKFLTRKFVLSESDDTLVYYVKENKDPKAIIRLSDLNATFVPDKLGHPHSLQLSFVKEGSTRHIFVYADDGKDIVDFYMAIRSVKLNRLQVAFPEVNEAELAKRLCREFIKEGYLCKTGPRSTDAYKKRWFTLDDRKLMYMEGPLQAYAKGEIFVGHRTDGYKVLNGVPMGSRDQGFSFTLRTPSRIFLLSAASIDERSEWIAALDAVINRPLTPQDNTTAVVLVRKRSAVGSRRSIFS